MKKSMLKAGMLSVAVMILVAGLAPMFVSRAQARPHYVKAFTTKYPNVKEADVAKCGICHTGASKKNRNDYGQCFGDALAAPNNKNAGAIQAALGKAEAGKSSVEGKTFGDLLKEGKLPGK